MVSTRAQVLGLDFDVVTTSDVLRRIESFVSDGSTHHIFFSNASSVVIGGRDAGFRQVVNESHVNCPDGISIVWAGRLLGIPFPERVAGPDFSLKALELAASKGYRVFFMGCSDETLERIKGQILQRWPNLQIAGVYAPPVCEKMSEAETAKIIEMLSQTRPHFLFVGLSCPKQEKWVGENRNRLPVSVCFTIGAAFDFIAGNAPRAPKFFQKTGLEWFHRLITEPRRLWRRYLIGNSRFIVMLTRELFHVKFRGKKPLVQTGHFEQ